MRTKTIEEFRKFLNGLNLKNSCTIKSLQDMFVYKDRDFIVNLERREVVLDTQCFYELYVETEDVLYGDEDTTVLIFETVEQIEKAEQFIKDNFKFK